MKTLDIALKDLKHVFTSIFSLAMMFGAPLFIAGLLYFAFGGLSGENKGYSLPVTKVLVANLDQPGDFAAGELLVDFLQDESLAEVIAVRLAPDEASARLAVEQQQAGAALIIPKGFSQAVVSPGQTAAVVIYHDPTLTIGPGILKELASHFMDGFSGAKIAAQVTEARFIAAGQPVNPALAYQAAQQYAAWLQSGGHTQDAATPRLVIISSSEGIQEPSPVTAMIGPVMAGMLIFFVFFMGANSAENIIQEEEQGTLGRIFGTPTPLAAILGGKFLGIVIILCIQTALLLLASNWLFGVHWGQEGTVILISISMIAAAAGFGVMLMSFIKNTRQTGPVLGGVMTLAGMLGGLFTTGVPNLPAGLQTVTLITPHGWALQAWKQALAGAQAGQVLLPALVLAGMGLAFWAVGVLLFRKRFA